MFWGLIMEPGRCYTQKVKVSFHVSMAALDISNSSDDPAQVMCVFEGRNYLLCTLNKRDKLQCPLDLSFEAGSKVSFATNGKAHVHLTGYLVDDYLDEEVEEEEAPVKDKKRLKKQVEIDGPPNKKSKIVKDSPVSQEEDEETDTSDSDFDVDKLMDAEAEEGEEVEEEEDEEEDGEEEEDEDEDASSLSGEEIDQVEEVKTKLKQNGIAKSSPSQKTQKKKSKEQKVPEKVTKEAPKKQDSKKKETLKKSVLKGGVIVQELKEGGGEPVKEGKFVHVYYEGRLKENNKMFDSTTKGPGFSFRVGKGEVIKGWDIGLVGMRTGGKRRIICPPKVAYGTEGSPPVIPPNATLVFDVEVKKVS